MSYNQVHQFKFLLIKTLFLNLAFLYSSDENETIEKGNGSNENDIEGIGNINTPPYSEELIFHEFLCLLMY